MDGCVGRETFVDGAGAAPGELLSHGPFFQSDVPETEGRQRVIPEFDCIVPRFLEPTHLGVCFLLHAADVGQRFAQIAYGQGFVVLAGRLVFGGSTTTQHVKHQNGEMAGDGPSAFAHQDGNRNVVGFTALPNCGHHVIGVVLRRVVGQATVAVWLPS